MLTPLGLVRRLFESLPFTKLIPDQHFVLNGPTTGGAKIRAARSPMARLRLSIRRATRAFARQEHHQGSARQGNLVRPTLRRFLSDPSVGSVGESRRTNRRPANAATTGFSCWKIRRPATRCSALHRDRKQQPRLAHLWFIEIIAPHEPTALSPNSSGRPARAKSPSIPESGAAESGRDRFSPTDRRQLRTRTHPPANRRA